MTSNRRVLGATLILIGLPLVVAAVEAVSFHVRNRNNGFLVSSGERREYRLYVPGSYERAKRPTPLVVSMHGAGGWPTQQMELDGWTRLADREGFIVAYPSGVEGAGPRVWRADDHNEPGLAKDVRFISDLIDRLESAYNIDPDRIYANGLSNGGGMSFALSCELSDRIAAVGMVAAAQTLPWQWCTDDRPMPAIVFHGTSDPMVPYNGGRSPIGFDRFPNVPAWAATWARRNRCGPSPVESRAAADVTRIEYTQCADDAAVVFYRVQGAGHTWPGGKPMPEWLVGPTSNGVDATSQMWEFFRRHHRRQRVS